MLGSDTKVVDRVFGCCCYRVMSVTDFIGKTNISRVAQQFAFFLDFFVKSDCNFEGLSARAPYKCVIAKTTTR